MSVSEMFQKFLSNIAIDNAEQIIMSQISNIAPENPILTIAGMRYCIDQFENEMSEKEEPKTIEQPQKEQQTAESQKEFSELE